MFKPGVPYNPVAPNDPGWTDSAAAGYQGWRFRNDVSKDGYAGLIFGYAVALEHFDDPGIAADIRSRLREIADHLVSNGLQIIDTTGIVTEHGRLYHSAMDDWPGFNAMLSSSWMKVASVELNDSNLDDFYYGCLMKTRKGVDCPDIENESVVSLFELRNYMDSMEKHLYLFQPGCQQNYDNFDMCYQAIYPLLRLETDKALRSRLVKILRTNMFHTDNPEYQSLAPIGNTWYTFAYAALTGDGPDDPMLASAVDRAVCTMKAFPEKKFRRHIPAGTQQPVCHSRLKNPVAALPIPLDEYDFDNYLWQLDFFEIAQKEIPENRREVFSPEDYLLAYWLGRYHGFIGEDM